MARRIVHHDVHVEFGWNVLLDCVEEAAELGRTMTRHALADDRACSDVERGKQRRRAMPLVVVGVTLGLPRPQRLRAVKRLHLGLLVDTQDHGAVWRIEIKPDDVAHLVDWGDLAAGEGAGCTLPSSSL